LICIAVCCAVVASDMILPKVLVEINLCLSSCLWLIPLF